MVQQYEKIQTRPALIIHYSFFHTLAASITPKPMMGIHFMYTRNILFSSTKSSAINTDRMKSTRHTTHVASFGG